MAAAETKSFVPMYKSKRFMSENSLIPAKSDV